MKRRQNIKCLGEVFIHIELLRESFEELTFSLQKLIKPSDSQLIKE
jgi:hypothetical protein